MRIDDSTQVRVPSCKKSKNHLKMKVSKRSHQQSMNQESTPLEHDQTVLPELW